MKCEGADRCRNIEIFIMCWSEKAKPPERWWSILHFDRGVFCRNLKFKITLIYWLTLRWRVSEIGKNAIFALKRVQNMHILSGEESEYAKVRISTSFSSSSKE